VFAGLTMGDKSARSPRREAPLPRLARGFARLMRRVAAATHHWAQVHGGPLARRAARAGGRHTGAASLRVARYTWARRTVLAGLVARAAWWFSLWLAVQGALVLLGAAPLGTDHEIMAPFVMGLAVAAAVCALSAERHLRRGGALLGAVQIGLLTLAWTALAPPGV